MRRHAFAQKIGGALLLVLLLGLIAIPGVFAEEPAGADPETEESGEADPEPLEPGEVDPELAERFDGKSWEDVVYEFFEERRIYDGKVSIGYYNTVTGEEHYINGDLYLHAASLYKLPLNMYYAEKVYNGEMTMDDRISGIALERLQTNSIQYSSNELSEILQKNIGTYREYKEAIAPYVCDDPETLDNLYYVENYFNAEQFIHALKMLYAEPERFPDILELMKKATPDNFFAFKEKRFVIAQKYGYFFDEGLGTLNDAAVVYTDEPILLVMITDFMSGGVTSMTDFCTLMCDYTQYGHQLRVREELLAAQQTPEPAPTPAPTPPPAPAPQTLAAEKTPPAQAEPEHAGRWNIVAVAVMGGLFVLTVVISLLLLKNVPRYVTPAAAAMLFALGLFFFGRTTTAEPGAVPETTPTPAQALEVTPAPIPMPAPEPTPEPVREVVLTGSGPEEVLELLDMDGLEHVDATASTCYEQLLELAGAKPGCAIDWNVDIGGVIVASSAESADLTGAKISAGELGELLQYLPALKTADICGLGFTNDQSLAVIERYPDIDFTWTVNFGRWAVRSDICVFSTLQSNDPWYRYTDKDLAPLFTYCTGLVALDLGHNAVTDLAPIAKLENLQVLIIPDNEGLKDITPLGDMRQLWYLEMFLDSDVKDYSALGKLTKMVDLNLSYAPYLTDVDFLQNMPELRMGWFKSSGIPPAQWGELQEAYPEAKLLFYYPNSLSSTCDDWRASERNVAIRKAFANWANVISFDSWDSVEYREGVKLTETYPMYERQ